MHCLILEEPSTTYGPVWTWPWGGSCWGCSMFARSPREQGLAEAEMVRNYNTENEISPQE